MTKSYISFMNAVKNSKINEKEIKKEEMKDVKKMQNRMKREGYIYCERHDVYYDEWNNCPACQVEILIHSMKDFGYQLKAAKKAVEPFNPEDRS